MHPQQSSAQPPDLKKLGSEKKLMAGILGIVLGSFGVHKFVLGYTQEGLIMLGVWAATFVIAIITCGLGTVLMFIPWVVGLVEGIMYLTKSDEEFAQTYLVNKKPWF